MAADYKKVIPFIKRLEGGLSRAKSDPAYANCQSGCQGTKGDTTATDWHTNKGITWCTFSSWAEDKGIPENKWCDMFINMSNQTFESIFKEYFWDKANLSELKSQAIAEYWLNARWGNPSTAQRILRDALRKNGVNVDSENIQTLIDAVNKYTNNGRNFENEEQLFVDFVETRKAWLRTLPAARANTGWFKRQDAFKKRGIALIRKKVNAFQRLRYAALGVIDSDYRTMNNGGKGNDMTNILIGSGILIGSVLLINYINKKK